LRTFTRLVLLQFTS